MRTRVLSLLMRPMSLPVAPRTVIVGGRVDVASARAARSDGEYR
jgi:hypothetical protein